jgi:hypothetical protein
MREFLNRQMQETEMPGPAIDQAWSIAEQLLGRRPDRLEPFRPAVGGDDSYNFRTWIRKDAMLLQIKRRAGAPLGVYFHGRLRCAGIPVPDLIAFAPTGGPAGQACAIWEWVEGQAAEWEIKQPCPYDEAELGRVLRRIHDLRCEAPFGMLGDDPGNRPLTWHHHPDLGPTSESWSGLFHCDRAARRYRDKGYLTAGEADVLASLPEQLRPVLDAAELRLLHMGDIMHNGNLIVDPQTGRILAVIDFADSIAGDPRWELACFDYYFSQDRSAAKPFDMDRFRAAYGTHHDPDNLLGHFYLLAILLFEKLLFFKPDSPRGRWAIETVKRILSSFEGQV